MEVIAIALMSLALLAACSVSIGILILLTEWLTLRLQWSLARHGWLAQRFLLQVCWPKGVDAEPSSSQEVQVRFVPQAPTTFLDLAERVQRQFGRPCVAAPAAAIALTGVVRLAEARLRDLQIDPILYLRSGLGDKATVAIMAQYGNFAAEQTVLEWARREGTKLCFK